MEGRELKWAWKEGMDEGGCWAFQVKEEHQQRQECQRSGHSDWETNKQKKNFREFLGRVYGYVVEIKLENSTGNHLYDV